MPAKPESVFELGVVASAGGRLLARGLTVPEDLPTCTATLALIESTPDLAGYTLPKAPEVQLPVPLLAKPTEGEGDGGAPPLKCEPTPLWP